MCAKASGTRSTIPAPTTIAPQPAGIPPALAALPQWVAWRWVYRPNGTGTNWTKAPVNPRTGRHADATDPQTWGTLAAALATADHSALPGIGFVFTESGPHFGIDLDGARDPDSGQLTPLAEAALARFPDCYAEPSPSGTGLHIIGATAQPPHDGTGNKRGPAECYWRGRFFTVTGRPLPGYDDPDADATEALLAWHAETFPAAGTGSHAGAGPLPALDLADAAVLANARRMGRFADLWAGGGAEDRSAGDLALCNTLVAAGCTDPGQMDRLVRSSGRHRPKWDQRRGRSTYGERTIARALDGRVVPFAGFRPPPAPPPPALPPCGPSPSPSPTAPDPQTLGAPPDGCAQRVACLEALLAERDAAIAALLAENARLEALPAEREAIVAALSAENARLREQVATFQAVQSTSARILGNRAHGPARVMAAALVTEIAWRSTAAEPPRERGVDVPAGMVAVTVKELAQRAGCSPNTAGTHLALLAERGLIRRLTRTVVRDFAAGDVDPETGEIFAAPTSRFAAQHFVGPARATALTPQAAVAFANNLAAFSVERVEKRGGQRLPRCPEHPTAGVVKAWVAACEECGLELARGVEQVPPMLLGLAPAPTPKVWGPSPRVVSVSRRTNLGDDPGPQHGPLGKTTLPGPVRPTAKRFAQPRYPGGG